MLMKIFVLACVMQTMEVWGTAILSFFDKSKAPDTRKALVGFSYLWMFPLYLFDISAFLLLVFILSSLAWYWIIPIVIIFGIVFVTAGETGYGWLLNKLLGFCPWGHYTKEQRGIFFGFSRWDWSLMYGGLAVALYYFIELFDYSLRWL